MVTHRDLTLKRISTKLTDKIIAHQPSIKRQQLDDTFHITVMQQLNYQIIKQTPGHRIITKYAGKTIGEKIAHKTQTQGLINALKQTQDLFTYLKIGDLSWNKNHKKITLTLIESVYSTGIKNTQMKLCPYLEGLMEGIINQSTQDPWEIIEKNAAHREETNVFSQGKNYPKHYISPPNDASHPR